MNNSVLILTFSPVQSFISEGRRISDLYVGSQILVQLAKAVGEKVIQLQGELIYPVSLKDDVPNKLVAKVDWDECENIAKKAREAFFTEWHQIVEDAKQKFLTTRAPRDKIWDVIWERQTAENYLWEFYWAGALIMPIDGYKTAYQKAEIALAGIKRTRMFNQVLEPNEKDSLSGSREALHTESIRRATKYWSAVSDLPSVTASKLKPKGRERLDSLGLIKRFSRMAETRRFPPFMGFPSTSSIASLDFVRKNRDKLAPLSRLLSKLNVFNVQVDPEWSRDGAFLYLDTYTPRRLEKDYGIMNADPNLIKQARQCLKQIYDDIAARPSSYYAVIVFDGDDMGKTINSCLEMPDPESAHKAFSLSLKKFSLRIAGIARPFDAVVIYNGGDDVLAVSTLADAIRFSLSLAEAFNDHTQKTASAGIAIVHHLYPLDKALAIARGAERTAKSSYIDKSAICVELVKRSGGQMQMVSKWAELERQFDPIRAHFQSGALSSQFAFRVKEMTEIITKPDGLFESELERLAMRHIDEKKPNPPNPRGLTQSLSAWAKTIPPGHLGNWLILARFIASGGLE